MHFAITGHTGFKGTWLLHLLRSRGHTVSGYSLPAEMNSLFSRANSSNKLVHNLEGDIRDFESLKEFAKEAEAEVVIHFAAQSLVRKSYKIPYETFDVNVVGTLNVLSAFRDLPTTRGGAVGLVDRLTCPTVWLPVLCEDQAGMDGLS